MVRKTIFALIAATTLLTATQVAQAGESRVTFGIQFGTGGYETYHVTERRKIRKQHKRILESDIGFHGPRYQEVVRDRHHGKRYRGPRHGHYDRISPRRAKRKLYRRGFDGIRFVRDRGDEYVFRAFGPRGARVKVWVDAYSGRIAGVRRLRWH